MNVRSVGMLIVVMFLHERSLKHSIMEVRRTSVEEAKSAARDHFCVWCAVGYVGRISMALQLYRHV